MESSDMTSKPDETNPAPNDEEGFGGHAVRFPHACPKCGLYFWYYDQIVNHRCGVMECPEGHEFPEDEMAMTDTEIPEETQGCCPICGATPVRYT